LRQLWGSLADAMRDPRWRPPDVFDDVAADPLRVTPHHRMLQSYARHDYPSVPAALRLRGDELLLDVGGGVGVLAELLLAEYPKLEVLLLDRPEVLAQAEIRLDDRLHFVPGDLFEPWSVTADVSVLARVLHDWDNERAVIILRNVRAALPVGGRVFVVEMLVSDDGSFGGLCDLHLLMATGGRERTAEEYEFLLRQAGFEPVAVRTLAALPSIIEGVAR
jgi:ubiquinone/menaquinone biosynthesis C-methylase UbiE